MPTVIEVVAVLAFLVGGYVVGLGMEALVNSLVFSWRARNGIGARNEAQMLADAIAVKRQLDEQAFLVHQQLVDAARQHQGDPEPRAKQGGW